jgi:hypothetical protein
MAEDTEARDFLLHAGFLHDVRDAHEATTRIVFGSLSRSAGFKERSFGYTAYDVLESQLDRVFRTGAFAENDQETDADRVPVTRDNLNGSPGWRCGPYRVLLKRYDLGAVDAIRWHTLSATKQAVSRQEFPDDPQLTFDLGDVDERQASDAPEIVTLVLAHSASEEPLEMELFVGRPRYNADGGSPWWWRVPLTRESLGLDPRRAVPEPAMPIWGDDEEDVPLRLRTPHRSTETQHETA